MTYGEGITPHESIPLPDYKKLISKKEGSLISPLAMFEGYINEILDSVSKYRGSG
jgi:hypothetical protein